MTSKTAAFWFPVIYTIAIGALFTVFIRWNRSKQRAATADAQTDGYFPSHPLKDQYNELAEMYSPEDPNGLKLLTTGLMKRAIEDIRRVFQMREEKQPLQQLVNKGTVGEDLLDKFLRAEQELDAEVNEVMEEAEIYRPGWGKTIFQDAGQLYQLQAQREAQIAAQRQAQEAAQQRNAEPTDEAEDEADETPESPKEDEEQRRQRIAEELLREEEQEKKRAAKAAKLPGGKGTKGKKKNK